MSHIRDPFCAIALIFLLLTFAFDAGAQGASVLDLPGGYLLGVIGVICVVGAWRGSGDIAFSITLTIVTLIGCSIALIGVRTPDVSGQSDIGFWLLVFSLWALAWRSIDGIAAYRSLSLLRQRTANIIVPIAFGLWLLFLWELIVTGFGVPQVLLPAPSMIGVKFASSLSILWADLVQTVFKAVLAGYIIGCASGFIVAVAVDRVPFLQRGLLPLGNLASALPIVGVAPIMVMWFGFDWQSKAAVVVIMTFFPMLVNTVAGLAAAGKLETELLNSYGASYWQTLLKLRIPASLPFVFNALKINSTLALIGAIVAEFFGTPIVGMGFRISTEVGRMNVDMVWAEILVAALVGSSFYGALALIERTLTFWHPSYRRRT